MTPRFWLLSALAAVVLAAAAFAGFRAWKSAAVEKRAAETIREANRLLDEKHTREAFLLVRSTRAPDKTSPLSPEWFDLEVRLAVATRQLDRLHRLQKKSPNRVARNPEAVAWLERLALLRPEAVKAVTESAASLPLDQSAPVAPPPAGWQASPEATPTVTTTPSTTPAPSAAPSQPAATPSSPLVRSDLLLAEGDTAKAREILGSTRLQGTDEINRLTRLALLEAEDDTKAWQLLSQAYALDARNSDVRTFSGNILEARGLPDLARRDYVAAYVAEPENPRHRNNLAEFYIRQGLPRQAVQTWLEAKPTPLAVSGFLRAFFWNRVSFGDQTLSAEQAATSPVLEGLTALPPGDFWSPALDASVDVDPALAIRGEVLWLRVLEALRTGNDPQAWQLLVRSAPEQTAAQSFLKDTLQQILAVRTGREGAQVEIPEGQRTLHPFWNWLAEHPADREALSQPWVLPALFGVNGWLRAATDLAPTDLAADWPDWVPYTLAQSARLCGDNAKLQQLLSSSPPTTPAMQILRAESAWANNRPEEGRDLLEPLLGTPEAGYRAAWLLGMFYLNENQPDEVRRVVQAQPDFASSVPGRELLARVHLLKEENAEARAIYEALGDQSDEARIWLAREAFVNRDWPRAEQLTRSLMASHPNEPAFVANLEAIEEARQQP